MKYCGNSKPYIYVWYSKENENVAAGLMDELSAEGVLFWYSEKIDKRELKRIEGAHGVLLFVSKNSFADDGFKIVVDQSVRCNKNILTVYLDDVELDPWGHMQLDSAQALFWHIFEDKDAFSKKLKEAQIFRNMQVTASQKRFRRNTALTAVFVPIISAALVFGLIVYPLLIVPAQRQQQAMEVFGLSGLTQEELDAITDINIMGDKVFTNVNDLGIGPMDETGQMGYLVQFNDGTEEQGYVSRGNITDLSDLAKCRNLKVLRICGNSIRDVKALAQLPKLERIVLEENPISSLEGLEDLENVWEISVNYTDIGDLKPIENYKNLRILCVRFTYVDKLPETGLLENIDYLNIEGSMVTKIPYLGKGDHRTVDVYRLPATFEDYSFLKDINSFDKLSIDGARPEELRPYLEGKEIFEFNDAGMNPRNLEEISWLNISEQGRLCICHSDELVSLEGIGHFEGIRDLDIKDCLNLTDLTPCLSLKSLEVLSVSSSMRELVETQLQSAKFEVEYSDD